MPLLWGLSLAATAVFAILVSAHVGNDTGWSAFEDLGETLAALIAALACASRARRDRREGAAQGDPDRNVWRAWRLLAYGMGVWALGHAAQSICGLGFGLTPKPPSALDAAPLASSVLVVGCLLYMVSTPAGRLSHVRGAAEGLLIATGVLPDQLVRGDRRGVRQQRCVDLGADRRSRLSGARFGRAVGRPVRRGARQGARPRGARPAGPRDRVPGDLRLRLLVPERAATRTSPGSARSTSDGSPAFS